MNIQTLAISGAYYGDEGKGKIVDYFSQKADLTVRYSGGDNAGHTIKVNNKSFKLSVIPSGILNPQTKVLISAGCVLNLKTLVAEINFLHNNGISVENLLLDERVQLIFDYHLTEDVFNEQRKGQSAIGTTKKGIGPCYADKINRIGIRLVDLKFKNFFAKQIKFNLKTKPFSPNIADEIITETYKYYDFISKYIVNGLVFLNKVIDNGAKVIFEGAQGTMLDLNYGTYPFVTSSHPGINSIAVNCGISFQKINYSLGIVKSYCSRVGNGVFLTHLDDENGVFLQTKGHEFGTVTRRARKTGWLDLVILKHAIMLNGYDGIALMLLDVLSGVRELKICTHYKLDGVLINYIPSSIFDYERCEPVYKIMQPWTEELDNVTSFTDLPLNAQKYIKFISNFINKPIVLFSVGPDRQQTVMMEKGKNFF